MSSSTSVERRLDAIRGGSKRRSATVRALAAFAQNTDCRLATLGFAAGVDFDRLLKGTRFQPAFGQSPFAFARGLAFEKMLRDGDYALTLGLLRGPLGLPTVGVRVVNLREGFPAGPGRMPARVKATADLLRRIIRGDPAAPHLIDGAVLRSVVSGIDAFFEADALAARATGGEIRVAEVKSFPKVDDRVDPDQLGSALDQSAVYVMLTRDAVAALGGDPERLVSDRVLLITPRNVGLTPTLSEQRVAARVTRMRRVFAAVPDATDVAAATPADVSFGLVADGKADEHRRLDTLHDIADRVGTAYTPGCLTTCGNARFCRARAVAAGSPCVSGTATVRLLPELLTLGRAESLTRGAAPTPAEAPAAALLERAGRLIDEAAPTAPDAPTRRTA
jgi:hypothetical protein